MRVLPITIADILLDMQKDSWKVRYCETQDGYVVWRSTGVTGYTRRRFVTHSQITSAKNASSWSGWPASTVEKGNWNSYLAVKELPVDVAAAKELVRAPDGVEPVRSSSCSHHGKREPRADYDFGMECLVKSSAEFSAAFRWHAEQTAQIRASTIQKLKRSMREWPTCSLGGELTIAYGTAQRVNEARWKCSHCCTL